MLVGIYGDTRQLHKLIDAIESYASDVEDMRVNIITEHMHVKPACINYIFVSFSFILLRTHTTKDSPSYH